MSSTILIIQVLNSLFYAAVLFLIAAGLSLIYGVMRIVNLAHGTFYALGAYVSAWAVGGAFGATVGGNLGSGRTAAAAADRRVRDRGGGRGDRADAAAPALSPAGGVRAAHHLRPADDPRGRHEAAVRRHAAQRRHRSWTAWAAFRIGRLLYPTYNLVVIGVGLLAAIGLWWFIYRTRFGVILRATSQDRRMASALGLNVGRVYVQAFAIGCFMAGLGGAVVVPAQAAVLGMGVDALILAFVVIVIGGLGSLEGALVGALIVSFVRTAGIQFFAEIELAVLYLIAAAVLLIRPTGLFGRA